LLSLIVFCFFLLFFYRFVFKQKTSNRTHLIFLSLLWFSLSISSTLILIEALHHSYFFLVPLSFFILFYFFYRQKKAQLINGMWFNLFLASFFIYLIYHMVLTKSWIGTIFIIALGLLGILYAFFGSLSLILLLYWNAIIVWRRERFALGNLLTLILALFLTFLLIYNHFIVEILPEWLAILFAFVPLSFSYFAIVFLNFLTISLIYQLNQPPFKQDFIIVLGAGLLNGEKVTPLLASRVDRALEFYSHQKKQAEKGPKLIFSGGQGPDEKISEAQAMKNYALQKGIPEEDIILEDQSTTTFENMKFSKQIISKSQIAQPKTIFSSNNYHIFRAAIFAQMNQLNADGIAAKTARYFLPNAFLREFIAMVTMNKKRHLVFLLCLSFCLAILAFVSHINVY
jgi:uncharacterized SAM-binding protein YcdF (DUF218 family)